MSLDATYFKAVIYVPSATDPDYVNIKHEAPIPNVFSFGNDDEGLQWIARELGFLARHEFKESLEIAGVKPYNPHGDTVLWGKAVATIKEKRGLWSSF